MTAIVALPPPADTVTQRQLTVSINGTAQPTYIVEPDSPTTSFQLPVGFGSAMLVLQDYVNATASPPVTLLVLG